ncbi:MAG: DUF402 domain-containing protein [Firmicutes bacterium]|nr:DUF402 domain-containing protein [Bacillota bacterium]
MRKKDILGNEWLSKRFVFSSSMRKLNGEYEGYSALIRFLPGSGELIRNFGGKTLRLAGEGYKWLVYQPTDENWALTALYGPNGELIQFYFDISRENFLDENGIPCRDDIFLDLVISPDGEALTKDMDELREALDKREITAGDYERALKTHDAIIGGKWNNTELLKEFCEELLKDYV